MGYKIKCFGWRNIKLDQISRIELGFLSLGHRLNEDNPDIIYANNDRYSEVVDFYKKQKKEPFLILNVLDLQIDNPNYPLEEIKFHLSLANKITCISETTKKQIKKYLGFNDITVIYNPSKPTYSLELENKSFPFLFVGRLYSENKRFNLIKETINLACWPNNCVKICGPENPFWGDYKGVVSDEELNNLYNHSGIVILPSKSEGIGLSFIESLQTYTPVIGCSDCEAAKEFLPECMICDPKASSILNKILEIKDNYDYYRQIAFEYGIKYKEQFSAKSVCKRILNLYEK